MFARSNRSRSFILPAPVKGLNMRDCIAETDPACAIVMDNYVPYKDKVVLRGGCLKYSASGRVSTLAVYKNGTGPVLLAVSGHKMHNVSSGKPLAVQNSVFFSDDECHYVQYKNYLYFMNGTDIPKVYRIEDNGEETLQNWGFYGDELNASAVIAGSVSKQRLWFMEKGTLRVWYTENAGNVSGELKCFDLSQVSRFGGTLAAVTSITLDGGQGIDDLTAFITSEGEVLVYSGYDVSDAADWKLRGSYKTARPVGYDCCLAYRGDVALITQEGYIFLSEALPAGNEGYNAVSFSDIIRDLVSDRTKFFAGRGGWQGIMYPRGGYALFNVPLDKGFEQHVVNINTGAWCRFTGINSRCWAEFDGRLYFGSDDGVYLFDEGCSDNGKAIAGEVRQAYTDLGSGRLKRIQLINPRTKSLCRYRLTVCTDTDMQSGSAEYTETIGRSDGIKWNKAKWSSESNNSSAKWENSGSSELHSQWISNSATGYKFSVVFKTETSGNRIEWYETGIRYEFGEGLL